MTHASCPDCRLRTTSASPIDAPPCPECGRQMLRTAAAASIGYRLVNEQPLPVAVAAAAALPAPPDSRS